MSLLRYGATIFFCLICGAIGLLAEPAFSAAPQSPVPSTAAQPITDVVYAADPGEQVPTEEAWLEESDVPSPPVTVYFDNGPCAEGADFSCAIYTWTTDSSSDAPSFYYEIHFRPHAGRRIFEHEIGHIFDDSGMLDDGARAQLEGFLGTHTWNQTSKERFAEAYSFCAIGRDKTATVPIWTGYFGFEISPYNLRQVCRIIHNSATRTQTSGEIIPSMGPPSS